MNVLKVHIYIYIYIYLVAKELSLVRRIKPDKRIILKGEDNCISDQVSVDWKFVLFSVFWEYILLKTCSIENSLY